MINLDVPPYEQSANQAIHDTSHFWNDYTIEAVWPNILVPENADQFYIQALTNSSTQSNFDWYYQPANEKEKWFKMAEGENILEQYGSNLIAKGATTNTLFISEAPSKYNGIKFKSVSKDSLKTKQVVGVAYGFHHEETLN